MIRHDPFRQRVVPQIACQCRWVLKRIFGCIMPAIELRVCQLIVSQPASAHVVTVKSWRMRAAVSGLSDLHAATDVEGVALRVASLRADGTMSSEQAAAVSLSELLPSSLAIAHMAASVVRLHIRCASITNMTSRHIHDATHIA